MASQQSLSWFSSCLFQSVLTTQEARVASPPGTAHQGRLCHSLTCFLSLWLACPGHFVCTGGQCAAWQTQGFMPPWREQEMGGGPACRACWNPGAFHLDGVPCPCHRAPHMQPHPQHSCPGEPTSGGAGPPTAECGWTPELCILARGRVCTGSSLVRPCSPRAGCAVPSEGVCRRV